MIEAEIKTMFKECVQDNSVFSKLNVSRDVVYNWKHGRGTAPTLGQMLETLYRLEKIKVESNDL